ncbi:anaerobic ribonucleoside-triphosphate reductase activating protein|uniref:Anaerobic ribonucleoside-triphosphate reductase-activating protein n=1 Tax=Dendrosporobacter quercicolus TaxID=146817 RepID=A0A1G9KG00_9FIRM|nr:anaerobic ribonucleoside-triphosphate reductase activating protein [Dendrosporobacter quercicolus]NSL49749.1 anaerobic ribonucleoside-triphosphate reductase activating protein [Dendrosporobacter quercicolus DSM 1736]SDL48611.1 anaerobic ribonucleoside-triphosphate reductase activating protein [Dendrosporobacter quercicolus]
MLNLRLAADITIDSVVDGPGLRTVVWCQGCVHQCPECHNPATHCPTGGFEKTVSAIIREILAVPMQSGVTFSGGEPMLQAKSCAAVARALKEQGRNIWCYTGFTFEELLEQPECVQFLNHIDVLVDGKFVPEMKSYNLPFRGSANQRLIAVPESLRRKQAVLLRHSL